MRSANPRKGLARSASKCRAEDLEDDSSRCSNLCPSLACAASSSLHHEVLELVIRQRWSEDAADEPHSGLGGDVDDADEQRLVEVALRIGDHDGEQRIDFGLLRHQK